jgi:8-oxo-dGTP diphosphatase
VSAASPSPPGGAVVRAAGAVLWRPGDDGVEVALVHRPKYDDWSFPKGKLDRGETHDQAAVREVEEETGCRGPLGPELEGTSYRDAKGRPKAVRYWSMRCRSEAGFVANDEVDELRWVDVLAAESLLSYAHDRDVLRSFVATVVADA